MQEKNPIRAIVWDLDGTIIHFKINSLKARRVAIKILKSHGIEKKNLSIKKSILDNLNTSRELFEQWGYNANQISEIFKKIDRQVSKIEHKAALKATKINGIEDVLIFARNKGLKQAIYTFNKYKHAKLSLEKVKLLGYFDTIKGRDNVSNPKPHPDHLLDICDTLSVKSNEIVV
ncbi:MAG: HAD family hydrolase, partial [Promethearchaeota archaeon]